MKMRIISILGLGTLILLFHACQVSNTAEQFSAVSPPFSKVQMVPEVFAVNAQRDTVLTTEKGSTLRVPARSLVDANGEVITGKVDISFTEYHTRKDIILSGIPMHYTENEAEGYLVTAGMCTITASYSGAEVAVAPDKAIEVELASEYLGDGTVDFFELNETTGEWTKKGKPTPVENPVRAALNSKLSVLENVPAPVVPRTLDPNEPVLNFNETENDLSQAGLQYSVWRYAGNSQKDNPLYKNAFTNNGYRLLRTERLFTATGMIRAYFEMGAYNEKEDFDVHDTLAVLLMPVAFGNELSKAQEDYQVALKDYQEQQARIAQLKAEMETMAKFRYAFQVREWRTFNCDVFSRNAFATYNVLIKMKGKVAPEGAITVLMTNENESGTINYTYKNGAPLRLFTEDYFSMAIIINDELCLIKDVRNHPNVKIKGEELIIKATDPIPVSTHDEISEALAGL